MINSRINSFPLKKIISDKIAKGDIDFLPYVIDYAEGSGHFLTEVMDEIHNIILELNEKNDFKTSIKKKLNAWTKKSTSNLDTLLPVII